jgi:broad specificity phosphatase PhoE
MKIYLLRHEDRTQDATFFSPLTKLGLENAEELSNILDKSEITHIYSSPFIRTLQTVYPFAKKNNKKIKLEYGLCEIQHQDIIPKKSYQVRLPEYMAQLFNYDSNYTEIIQPEKLEYPEDEKSVLIRIKEVLKHIISIHGSTNDTILLVTHQIVCRTIMKIIKKFGVLKPSEEALNNYPKGGLTLVLDEMHWIFKPINWKEK